MKRIGQSELRCANFYGIKSFLRRVLLLPLLNPVVTAGAKPFIMMFPRLARLPGSESAAELLRWFVERGYNCYQFSSGR